MFVVISIVANARSVIDSLSYDERSGAVVIYEHNFTFEFFFPSRLEGGVVEREKKTLPLRFQSL